MIESMEITIPGDLEASARLRWCEKKEKYVFSWISVDVSLNQLKEIIELADYIVSELKLKNE